MLAGELKLADFGLAKLYGSPDGVLTNQVRRRTHQDRLATQVRCPITCNVLDGALLCYVAGVCALVPVA